MPTSTSTPRVATRDPKGLFVAVLAAGGIGMLGSNSLPLLLGAVMDDLGVGERLGGLMGTFELAPLAFVSLFLATRIGNLHRGKVALWGSVVVVIGFAISASADSYPMILVGRFIGGGGAGAVTAASSSALAASNDPDSLMAKALVVGGFLAALLLGTLPWALDYSGYHGGFAALSLVALFCIPFARKLPTASLRTDATSTKPIPHTWIGTALLLAMMLDAFSQGGLWAFSERIGILAGLTVEEVGIVLAATTLAGLGGAVAAFFIAKRAGRVGPIAVALAVGTVARWWLVQAANPADYWIAQLMLGVAFFLAYPFMMGAIASLDKGGRWAAASAGVGTIGGALGPVVSGYVVESAGYSALGIVCVSAAFCTAALTLPAVHLLGKEAVVLTDINSQS